MGKTGKNSTLAENKQTYKQTTIMVLYFYVILSTLLNLSGLQFLQLKTNWRYMGTRSSHTWGTLLSASDALALDVG